MKVDKSMRITESQLRKIIREEARSLREAAGYAIPMGSLIASIPGDTRYADRLSIAYDPSAGRVVITVSESAAAGGMDSFTGSSSFGGEQVFANPDPESIMKSLSRVIQNPSYLFKRYGKPTKNFTWAGTPERGLSLRLVKAALDSAMME